MWILTKYNGALLVGLLLVLLIEVCGIVLIDDTLRGDALQYMRIAENLDLTGIYSYDGVTPSRALQPIYPLFLTVMYWSLGEHFMVVRMAQAILGLISFALALLIYRRIHGSRFILIAALVLSLYVPLWVNAGLILSEMMTIFLMLLFMWAFQSALSQNSWRRLLIAGALLGLAVLTRPIVVSMVGLIWLPIVAAKTGWKRRLKNLALVAVGLVIALLPWAIRNYQSCDRFTPLPPSGAGNLLFASSEDSQQSRDSLLYIGAGEQEQSFSETEMYSTAFKNILKDPIKFVWRGVRRIAWVWSFIPGTRHFLETPPLRILTHLAAGAILLLAFVGLFRLPAGTRLLLLYPPLSFTLLFFFTHTTPRYLLPVMPFVLISAVSSLMYLPGLFRQRRQLR
ncbi:MAG: glycosyltransferase family 39 protein [candidate division Zixibacteria bacterium]|nr:glycosyltransferase family 39 protein [candidate division Zixibacteria bacterium]MBU1471958.1 glycosyltransferase family 39 protein [candidate division Zixibacteria bacterium]MBU2626153.1 glycosyltransferase family 39 protein [candidate division Zixibacteria bacterium]